MSILSTRLRQARQALHPEVQQKDIAKRLGLSPSAVNLWEAGKTEPSAGDLVQLARWYRVSCDWLLGLDSADIINISEASNKKDPPVTTVSVVLASEIAKWQWDSVADILQTGVAYATGRAAGMVVSCGALSSVCPPGCYAVISKDHEITPGCIVLASANSQPPMLRRYVQESGVGLLVADDARFPTFQVDESIRIIGKVTEITIRKVFV